MNWWRISPSKNLRDQFKDSVHLLEQVGYMENDESFGKVKLGLLLERKFGDKFSVVPYNKNMCVTVIGLAREEKVDCPLFAKLVRDQGKEKNKKWMDLKKSVVFAAEINLMQHKAIEFLKEAAAKERAEALNAAIASISIATVTITTVLTTVATPYVQSQQ
jgi:hypothetical protein